MLYLHPLYVDYFAYFNKNHDFFECHEVLEEYWKELAPGDKEHVLVGLVQLATGMYHWRRHNTKGALRILQKAQTNLKRHEASPFLTVLDYANLQHQLTAAIDTIKNSKSFQTFPIIIKDDALLQAVAQKSATLPKHDTHYLHNKHMLRDRSEVLEARAEKIASKKRG